MVKTNPMAANATGFSRFTIEATPKNNPAMGAKKDAIKPVPKLGGPNFMQSTPTTAAVIDRMPSIGNVSLMALTVA